MNKFKIQSICFLLIATLTIAFAGTLAFSVDMNNDELTPVEASSFEKAEKSIEKESSVTGGEEIDTMPDGEKSEVAKEAYVRPVDRLYSLRKLDPGEIEYVKCELPASPIASMAVFEVDEEKSPGLVFVTTNSMEAYHFTDNGAAAKIWSAEYSAKYPRRGFAANAVSGVHRGKSLLFVSINKFRKAFAYKWEQKQFVKAGRVNGSVVDVVRGAPVNMVSTYGSGVIAFDGGATRFVDNTGSEPMHSSYSLHVSYYSACILHWNSVSPNLASVAAVDQSGILNIFVEGQVKYRSDVAYGGIVKCAGSGRNGGFIYITSDSEKEDSVIALSAGETGLQEIWRSPSLGGSIVAMDVGDMDRDGDMEIIGVLRSVDGKKMLFRVRPDDGRQEIDIRVDSENE